MRNVCLAVVFAFLPTSPASAQSWANKIFNGSPEVPLLHDFGAVPGGAQLQANLKMTNIYKVPLTITEIRPSCNCVEVKASKMTLQPNETATLNIRMDGTRFSGPKSVNVFVTFGPQFIATANIVVSANARQDVVLNPGEIDFGSIQRGSTLERSLDVECAGKPNWKVVQIIKGPNAPFDLRSVDLQPRNDKGAVILGYRLTATLKPNAPVGPFRETIDLITNDATQQKLSFVISGTVAPPVSVAPNPIQVTNLRMGNAFNTKVVVTANQPFRIIGMQGNGGDVNLRAPDRSAATHVLDLNVTPTAPGLLSREITLQTDMRNETVKVLIQGNVSP